MHSGGPELALGKAQGGMRHPPLCGMQAVRIGLPVGIRGPMEQ